MAEIFVVKSSTEKQMLNDKLFGNQVVRYVTLTDKNPASENRYYVSLTGQNAEIEWHEGDKIMLELCFVAYKSNGHWYMGNSSDAIELVEFKSQNNE